MKLKHAIRQVVAEHSKEGAGMVLLSGQWTDAPVLDCSPSHLMVKSREVTEEQVRKYLWEHRREVDRVRTGGGLWAKWFERRGVSVVGLFSLGVANG